MRIERLPVRLGHGMGIARGSFAVDRVVERAGFQLIRIHEAREQHSHHELNRERARLALQGAERRDRRGQVQPFGQIHVLRVVQALCEVTCVRQSRVMPGNAPCKKPP